MARLLHRRHAVRPRMGSRGQPEESRAAILQAATPVMVALGARFYLKERLRRRHHLHVTAAETAQRERCEEHRDDDYRTAEAP